MFGIAPVSTLTLDPLSRSYLIRLVLNRTRNVLPQSTLGPTTENAVPQRGFFGAAAAAPGSLCPVSAGWAATPRSAPGVFDLWLVPRWGRWRCNNSRRLGRRHCRRRRRGLSSPVFRRGKSRCCFASARELQHGGAGDVAVPGFGGGGYGRGARNRGDDHAATRWGHLLGWC